MDLSIIIVNYYSAGYLFKCLESINHSNFIKKYEIIVVDNASYDRSEHIVKNYGNNAKFIQANKNLGFSKANNLGYQNSSGKFLLFLNPDTELYYNTLTILYRLLNENEDAGAIGCKLLNSDFTIQKSCIKKFPNIIEPIYDIEFIKRIFPYSYLWGNKALNYGNYTLTSVDVLSGACIMVKRHVFEEANCFDEDYFMYSEDVQLCYNIYNIGKKIYYTNRTCIIHHGGKSICSKKHNFNAEVKWFESRYIYFNKTKGRKYAKKFKYIIGIIGLLRYYLISIALYFKEDLKSKDYNFEYSKKKWKCIVNWSLNANR